MSDEEFVRLVQAGTIHDLTLVWRQGMPQWKSYAEVAPTLSIPPPVPSSMAAPVPAMGTAQPGAAPVGSPTLREPLLVAPVAVGYGGFWLRLVATLIDGIILFVVGQVVTGMLMAMIMPESAHLFTASLGRTQPPSEEEIGQMLKAFSLLLTIGMAVGILYEVVFLAKFGATPGKMALGLRVQRPDGSLLSIPRIIGRYFAKQISFMVMCIGYIIAAFDDQKRALHDYMCDSRVIRTR